MWNFSQVLLVALTIWFTCKVSVYCDDRYPFEVEEDDVEVEKLFIKYTRSLSKPKVTFTKVLDSVLDLACGSDVGCESDPSEKVEDVCDLTKRNKLYLCRVILRLNYFGLQFDIKRSDDIPRSLHKVSLKHSTRKLDIDELEIFQCPPLKYIDLATDETIFLLAKYFVSSGHLPYSFFLYVQKDPKLPMQPHKFASSVYFERFHLERNSIHIDEMRDEKDAGDMTLGREGGLPEKYVSEYIQLRKLPNVYEKFQKFYRNRIFCAMPHSHKIAVCRYVAKQMSLTVDYRGYDESRCRKREVFSNPDTPEDINGHYMSSFQTIKCPALYNPNENKFVFKTIFITSSHVFDSAVFVLQRLNLRQHEVKPEGFTFKIRLEMLTKDRRRIREFQHLMRDDNKTFAPIDDSTRKQSRQLIIQPQSIPFVFFNRGFIENYIISYVEIMQLQKPYERFMKSYGSVSINMWFNVEIDYLCTIILQGEPYNLSFELKFTNFPHRSDIEAELLMRDAEILPNKRIRARQCSPDFNSSSIFYIVGTLKTDMVIVYVKYENENYVIPHSYVDNIKKAEIRDAVNEIRKTRIPPPSLI